MNSAHEQNNTKRQAKSMGELQVLTADQALRFLGGVVGRTTFYKALRNGSIPARRLGKKFLIPRRRLLEWLEGGDVAEAHHDRA